jgi:hypothetical protein
VLNKPGSKTNKVFLLLFVHKKKCFLALPSSGGIRAAGKRRAIPP